jgi:hypothetical protein
MGVRKLIPILIIMDKDKPSFLGNTNVDSDLYKKIEISLNREKIQSLIDRIDPYIEEQFPAEHPDWTNMKPILVDINKVLKEIIK